MGLRKLGSWGVSVGLENRIRGGLPTVVSVAFKYFDISKYRKLNAKYRTKILKYQKTLPNNIEIPNKPIPKYQISLV